METGWEVGLGEGEREAIPTYLDFLGWNLKVWSGAHKCV